MNPFPGYLGAGYSGMQTPLNPFNTTPGDWGVNPYYLTPSYTAPYRPDTQLDYGTNPYAEPTPTMAQAIKRLVSPMAYEGGFGTNYNAYNQPAFEAIPYTPADKTMDFAQSWGVPLATTLLANQMFKWKTRRTNTASEAVFRHGYDLFSSEKDPVKRAAEAARKASQQPVFSAMGDRFGQGAAKGFFWMGKKFSKAGIFGESAIAQGTRTAVTMGAGMVGAGISSVAFPYAIGAAGMKLADAAIFDPYSQMRLTDRNLRQDTSQITFGEGEGNTATGKGLSFAESKNISNQLTMNSIKDFAFDTGDFGKIADVGMRAGLFNTVNDPKDIVKYVTQAADSIKLVMAVARDSNVVEAVKILADLKLNGAKDIKTASRAFQDIGFSASIAGVSAKRLVEEIGSTGKVSFAQNGLVPYLGMMAAANSYASFASAERTHAISPNRLAMMGGVAGAAQSSLEAQIQGVKNPTYKMILAVKAKTGEYNPDPLIARSKFSEMYRKEPFAMSGEMLLNSPMRESEAFENGTGLMALKDSAVANMKRILPKSAYMTKDGKIRVTALASAIKMDNPGMTDEQIRAYIYELKASSDPETVKQRMKSIRAEGRDKKFTLMSQEGLYAGSETLMTVRKELKSFKGLGANLVGMATDGFSEFADYLNYKMTGFKYDREDGGGALPVFDSKKSIAQQLDGFGIGKTGTQRFLVKPSLSQTVGFGNVNVSALEKINKIADGGSQEANKFIATPNKKTLDAFLATKEGKAIKNQYKDTDGLLKQATSAKTVQEKQIQINHKVKAHSSIEKVANFLPGFSIVNLVKDLNARTYRSEIDQINELAKGNSPASIAARAYIRKPNDETFQAMIEAPGGEHVLEGISVGTDRAHDLHKTVAQVGYSTSKEFTPKGIQNEIQSRMSSALGDSVKKGAKTFEMIQAVSASEEILNRERDGEWTKTDEYKTYVKALSDATGKDYSKASHAEVIKKAAEINNRSLKSKIDSDKLLKPGELEAVFKNPSLIKNPEDRKIVMEQFKGVKSFDRLSADKKERVGMIYMAQKAAERYDLTGRNAFNAPSYDIAENAPPEIAKKINEIDDYTDKRLEVELNRAKANNVDFSELTGTLNAVKMASAIDKFGVYVDEFGKKVGESGGNSLFGGSTDPVAAGASFARRLFSSDDDKRPMNNNDK